MKRLIDELNAFGHENVLATHPTTLEITTENFLTLRGNCILAIKSNKSVNNFSQDFKKAINENKKIEVELDAGGITDSFIGFGHKELTLTNEISIVFRTSTFNSDRTALLSCSKASNNINRKLIQYLTDPSHKIIVRFYLHE
jgi:uncharacterized protein